MEKILILDNYDSFTYNIVHLLHELGAEVDIARNDRISVEEAGRYNRIILSPGPGIPSEAGILPEVVKRYAAEKQSWGFVWVNRPSGSVSALNWRICRKFFTVFVHRCG